MKELEHNKEGYIIGIENGTCYYEDKDGNIYKNKEEYLRESRDLKISEILKPV